MTEYHPPRKRVAEVRAALRAHQVVGRWVLGTTLGPGKRDPSVNQRMNMLYGPDGWVIEVAPTNGRASMARLRRANARRPVLVQFVGEQEMVRLPLSDFLDLLAVYTMWLAQEGRLGQSE